MPNYRTQSRARDKLQGPHSRSNQFIPAFAVRRHVPVEDGTAQEIQAALKCGIKKAVRAKDLPRRFAKHCTVVEPERMCVTIIERGRLREGIVKLPAVHPNAHMRYLAQTLQHVLVQKARAEGSIHFETGELDRFGEGYPKRTIGATLRGWRGPRAHYPEYNMEGERSPTSMLQDEKEICLLALGNNITLHEDFSLHTRRQTPHLSLVSNAQGFRDHEFRMLAPVISAALPSVIPLQDPTIYLHTEPGSKQPREIVVTPDLEVGAPVHELHFPEIIIEDFIDDSDLYAPYKRWAA